VLSHAARFHALGFELERAETLGEEALAIANRLGLKELQAFTLNNLSVARIHGGNLAGAVELLEEAAQIAREEHSPELLRVLNNLLVAYQRLGWLQRHDEALEEFERFATELGDVVLIRFTRGSAVPFTHLLRGRWDEALRTASAFIAQAEVGEGHRLLGSCYTLRALIRHARGDSDGALADCDRSATLVDVSDPANTFELAMRGRILLECGRREEAIELADRAVELTRSAPFFAHDVSLTFLLHALGRSDEQLRVMPEVADVPIPRAIRLWASGDIRGAAAVFASLELAPFGEAFARLAAGRQFVSERRLDEADVELLRAIELFGRMGAHRYLQEANALLSTVGARAQPG
jgi:tetratricopeptide (TPR) repeat protein